MAIQALPPSTTRILNSSQVLTTPVSLVKELIDNALDARASAVEIVISSNTLDRIEVRDNGHGIAADDLHALGRYGHTSKLRNFEDLKTVGGASLGFRGAALASAIELGDVTVTTRTEGEAAAATVKLIAPGRIESQSTASHPVGTTVSVANFLSRLPVRRQKVQDESRKTLIKIKDMLQSYALARLTVRLGLKVLKTPKSNWLFVSRPTNTVHEVVSQVIGREIAIQCMEKTSIGTPVGCENVKSGADSSTAFVLGPSQNFVFQGFLPRPDADFSKMGGRHHVSIDSRPVSCARGTLKKLVAIYRTHLRALATNDGEEKLKNSFIRLNIVCPTGSYDPNVEPAKDDVIFESEAAFLNSAEQWFKDIYGESTRVTSCDREPVSLDNQIQARFAKMDAENTQRDQIAVKSSYKQVPTRIFTPHKSFGHLSPPNTRFQAPHTGLRRPSNEYQNIEQGTIDAWLNRSSDCRSASSDKILVVKQLTPSKFSGSTPPSKFVTSRDVQIRGDFFSASSLPHVHASNDRPIRVALDHQRFVDGTSPLQNNLERGFDISRDFSEELDPSDSVSELHMARYLNVRGGCNEDRTSTTLNPWIIARLNASTKLTFNDPNPAVQQFTFDDNFERTPSAEHREQDNVVNADSTPSRRIRLQKTASRNNTLMHCDFSGDRKANVPVNRCLKPLQSIRPQNLVRCNDKPVPALESNPRDLNDDTAVSVRSHPRGRTQLREAYTDFHKALEFDRQQKVGEHIQSHTVTYKDYTGEASPPLPLIDRPPKRNTTSILPCHISSHPVSNIRIVEEDKGLALIMPPDGDPGADLMRRQKSLAVSIESGARPKLKRTKTMLLPLEFVPEVERLSRLVRVLRINVDTVRNAFIVLGGEDCWAVSGSQYIALDISVPELLIVEKNTREVLKRLEVVVNGVK